MLYSDRVMFRKMTALCDELFIRVSCMFSSDTDDSQLTKEQEVLNVSGSIVWKQERSVPLSDMLIVVLIFKEYFQYFLVRVLFPVVDVEDPEKYNRQSNSYIEEVIRKQACSCLADSKKGIDCSERGKLGQFIGRTGCIMVNQKFKFRSPVRVRSYTGKRRRLKGAVFNDCRVMGGD